MSQDILIRQAVFDFNQFISSLARSRAVDSDDGEDVPLPLMNFRHATREEAVDLFLRVRGELLPYRQAILDSAKRAKYRFDDDKWRKMCDSVEGENR